MISLQVLPGCASICISAHGFETHLVLLPKTVVDRGNRGITRAVMVSTMLSKPEKGVKTAVRMAKSSICRHKYALHVAIMNPGNAKFALQLAFAHLPVWNVFNPLPSV
jgi:hypothetical protein